MRPPAEGGEFRLRGGPMTSPTPNIHRWRAFSLLAVAAFMTVMDLTIVNTAVPTIGRDLHFSQTSLLWVVTAYELAYGGFLLLGGRAADLLGRRRVIIAGLAVFTASSLGASLAGSEAVLIAMRVTQGFGAALAIGVALLGAFLVIESRGKAPLMPLRIFRLQTLAGANAVGFLLGASFYSFIFIGTLYMQQVLGFSALQGGFAWAASGVASMLFAGISQALVTKISAKLVMAFGMTVLGIGIFWTAQAPVHGHFLGDLFGPFLVAVGLGTAFTFIPIQIAALAGVAQREAGLASGLIYTSQELGAALGIAIASSIAASHYTTLLRGGDTIRAALTGGFHSALWVSGVIALLAIPVTFLLIRKDEMEKAVAATALGDPQPEPAT